MASPKVISGSYVNVSKTVVEPVLVSEVAAPTGRKGDGDVVKVGAKECREVCHIAAWDGVRWDRVRSDGMG